MFTFVHRIGKEKSMGNIMQETISQIWKGEL